MQDNKFFKFDNMEIVDEGVKSKSTVKYCKQCKTQNDKTAKFCIECGHNEFYNSLKEIHEKKLYKYCVKCKTKVSKSTKFCINCGSDVFDDTEIDSLDVLGNELDQKYQNELAKIKKQIDEYNKEIKLSQKNKEDLNKKLILDRKAWASSLQKLNDENKVLDEKLAKKSSEITETKQKVSQIEKEISDLNTKITETENIKLEEVKQKIAKEEQRKKDLSKEYDTLKVDYNKYKALDKIKKEKEEAEARAKQEFLAKQKKEAEEAEKKRLEAIRLEKIRKEEERQAQLEKERQEKIRLDKIKELFPKALDAYKKKDYKTSLVKFEELAKLNDKESCGYLALHYFFGYGTVIDNRNAEYFFGRTTYEFSWLAEGLAYFYGRKKPVDYNLAKKYFEKARSPQPLTYYYLGLIYENGYGVKKDKTRAMGYYKLASDKGVTEAMVELGRCYIKGLFNKEYDKALVYFEKAAKLNDGVAMNEIGLICNKDYNLTHKKRDAANWFLKGYQANNMDAAYNYACYLYDKGDKTALKIFEEAAKNGQKDAQKFVINLYKNGDVILGVTKDPKKYTLLKYEYRV